MSISRTTLTWIIIEACASRWAFGLMAFALPLYALQYGISDTGIGILMSFHFVFELLLKPWLGGLADRVGLRPALTGSLLVRSSVPLLLAIASGPFCLFVARGIHGASESLREPTMNSLLAATDAKKAIKMFAHYNTARMLAGTLGKASAGYILTLSNSNFRALFLVVFAVSLISIVSAIKLTALPNIKREHDNVSLGHQPDNEKIVKSHTPVLVYGLIGGVAVSLLNLLLPLIAVKYVGLTVAQVGTFYVLAAVSVIFSNLFITKMHDRLEGNGLLTIRAGCSVVSSVLYGVATGILLFGLGVAIDEFGKLAFKAGWGGLLAQIASSQPQRKSAIAAHFGVVENLAEVSGPVLGGILLGFGGPTLILFGRVLLVVVAEIFLRKTKHQQKHME